jgi:hypothetical protein
MGKGYAEGPAVEEHEAELERRARGTKAEVEQRLAVYGATDENHETHFLGWRDELDPDDLFASGRAWGISVRRRPV